ncbi:MAG: SRPBCC family protein [Polaromonas sp.]|nr:SRPBCC family protein [Polaromonas sp.]
MFKTIALSVAVLLLLAIGIVLLLAARKPDAFRVERSTVIQAPPVRVFALVNDLPAWRAWSPYEKKDPAMQRSYSGPSSGVGAAYAWEGNGQVGQGTMKIVQSVPAERVSLQLDFIKPFEGHNIADFSFVPEANGQATRVTWAMHGPAPFVSKIMQVLMDFDKMIGRDFETGLADLKTAAEKTN